MPSRSLNRRRFDVAADGHTGNCGRVAVFNGCNAALGQTGTFGQEQSFKFDSKLKYYSNVERCRLCLA
ncbi:Uncharacterised protein [Comamonas testosteroni]|uniref:Uncharacterized protein n=1 Tax=Comamonas testosteroni TaxID=285 RepID=A0A8B4S7P9_COMTE|nr:Uncharacterised protein [Comamonas testosteroni]